MPKLKKETRKFLINHLTNNAVDTAQNANQWLEEIFKKGHKGYENMTDKELIEEFYNHQLNDNPDISTKIIEEIENFAIM